MSIKKGLQWSISYHEKQKKKRAYLREVAKWYKKQRAMQLSKSLVKNNGRTI